MSCNSNFDSVIHKRNNGYICCWILAFDGGVHRVVRTDTQINSRFQRHRRQLQGISATVPYRVYTGNG